MVLGLLCGTYALFHYSAKTKFCFLDTCLSRTAGKFAADFDNSCYGLFCIVCKL